MASEESLLFNQNSSAEALERRMKMLQQGIRKRVLISHDEELDPSLIVRIVQMRYDHCSSKHIAIVLGLEENVVSSVIQKDSEILKEFIGRTKANDELQLSRIPRSLNELEAQIKEHGQWGDYHGEYDYSLDALHLPTKREVADYSRNFLKERLSGISNYKGQDTTTFSWIKDKPFAYEFAFLNRDRVYHLVRMISENSMSFIVEKCWQLFHEGFKAEEIDAIFENRWATGFRDLAKHIDLKIDRRNNSIITKSNKKIKSKTEIKFQESLHLFDNSSSDQVEFYMNINTGNGKVKSIRSIFKGL